MTAPVKNNADQLAKWYGEGPHYIVSETLLGGGAAALTIPAVGLAGTTVATSPPCGAEVVSIVHNSTGNYTLTFADANYAVADARATIDDVNGTTPMLAFLGQWGNLGTNTPTTVVLTTYNSSFAATDVATTTLLRLFVVFKKDNTGAAA